MHGQKVLFLFLLVYMCVCSNGTADFRRPCREKRSEMRKERKEKNKSETNKQKLVYRSILRNDRARPNA